MTYGDPSQGTHSWTLDEAASRPLIKRALDLGINFLDTANVLKGGISPSNSAEVRSPRRLLLCRAIHISEPTRHMSESRLLLCRVLSLLFLLLRSILVALRSRREVTLENLVLRHQLQVALRTNPSPRLTNPDRLFWVWLRLASVA
jgi:hypothetical protein